MKDKFNLGLWKEKERLKDDVYKYLNKKTIGYKLLLSDLIDCIYDIQETKSLTDKHLLTLEKGLKQPYELVFCDYSGKYLCCLAHSFDSVKNLILRLSSDKQLRIRFNIVTIMLYNPPPEIIYSVLINGLKDKSFKIREKSADIALRLEYKEIYKNIDDLVSNEENTINADKIKFYRDLALNGYILKETCNGFDLTVKTKNGFTGRILDKNDLKSLDKIIRQIKNE